MTMPASTARKSIMKDGISPHKWHELSMPTLFFPTHPIVNPPTTRPASPKPSLSNQMMLWNQKIRSAPPKAAPPSQVTNDKQIKAQAKLSDGKEANQHARRTSPRDAVTSMNPSPPPPTLRLFVGRLRYLVRHTFQRPQLATIAAEVELRERGPNLLFSLDQVENPLRLQQRRHLGEGGVNDAPAASRDLRAGVFLAALATYFNVGFDVRFPTQWGFAPARDQMRVRGRDLPHPPPPVSPPA